MKSIIIIYNTPFPPNPPEMITLHFGIYLPCIFLSKYIHSVTDFKTKSRSYIVFMMEGREAEVGRFSQKK